MNRYLIRQKFFKIADHFDIKDDRGYVRFTVKSKIFTIGKKFWIYSPSGQEIFYIKQRLFRLLPRYDLYNNGNFVGKIKGKFRLFVKRLKVTSDYGDYTIKGNVLAWDFKILDENDNIAGAISKSILKIADTYTVDAYANDALILAIAIVLDRLYHPKH